MTPSESREILQVKDQFKLYPNYPNPFNPSTQISFRLAEHGATTLRIYDLLGREVATLINGQLASGNHTVNFIGSGLSSGIYFVRLVQGSNTQTHTITLVK